ncbi:MAG: hypothetical protein ABI321_02865 [Polyangia bacterium]
MGQALWLILVACHGAAAATWWWMMAGGFPSSSSEYWVNEVAPIVIVLLCAAALLPPQRLRAAVFPALTGVLPLFWMALALAARLTFPRSVGISWNVTFFASLGLAVMWFREVRPRLAPAWLLPCLALPVMWAGWSFPATQRAPEPSTHPAGAALAELPKAPPPPEVVKLGKSVQLHPREGRVVLRRDRIVLTVDPLLTFLDRTPDRAWVDLALPDDARPTKRRLLQGHGDRKGWTLEYADEDRSLLGVTPRDDGVLIEAASQLAKPVFAHLDTYAEVTLRGHTKLSVSFSPAPEARIELPAFGAATRFAYVDAARVFHVAEATKLDKGPFHELARGRCRLPHRSR